MAQESFEIRCDDELVYLEACGTLTLEGIYRLDRAFWDVWSGQTRILMDYTGLTDVAVSVAEFIQAGIASQAGLEPPGREVKAVYVSRDPNVYAFTRVIEEVWSSYVTVTTGTSIDEALAWLGCAPDRVETLEIAATG